MHLILLDIPVVFGLSIEVYFILVLIAVPTFFFWDWVLKKYVKVYKTRKIGTWTATLISTPMIYFALIGLFMLSLTYTPSKDFDRSQWLTDKDGRFQMAGDIINSKMLIGKGPGEVKQILGDPTWGMDKDNSYTYDMGFGGGGLGFMFHHLIVRFNKNKAVFVEHAKIRD